MYSKFFLCSVDGISKPQRHKRKKTIMPISSSADTVAVGLVPAISRGFYEGRCNGLTDDQIQSNLAVIRGMGVKRNHALEFAAMVRQCDCENLHELVRLLLVLRPEARHNR